MDRTLDYGLTISNPWLGSSTYGMRWEEISLLAQTPQQEIYWLNHHCCQWRQPRQWTKLQHTYTQNKATWSKKNAQGLGIIQATVSNVIWQKHQALPTSEEVLDALEAKFWKVGGAQTYLQLVNMVKIQITDSTDLLPQIQKFQDNYNLITSNGHSTSSEDLATFLFCSSLPDSYELTARQYLDNVTVIANYKLSDIIARVLQEENRRKANGLGQGTSINKFSTTKTLGQKCAKCGKTNHTTQNHWPGGHSNCQL